MAYNNGVQINRCVSVMCNDGVQDTINKLIQLKSVCLLCLITVYDIPQTLLLFLLFETQINQCNTSLS